MNVPGGPGCMKEKDITVLINRLSDLALNYNVSLPIPQLLVVGKQSAGKSSIVEAFLGFPFNYVVAGEIGTRRPLFLRLIRDKSAVLPQWTDLDGISSIPMTTQQVRVKLEAANQQARNRPGGVDSTPLRFEVKYKDCVPISFTDMPGLRFNAKTQEDEQLRMAIQTMVLNTLRSKKPNDIVLLADDCFQETENSAVIGLCQQPSALGFNLPQTILLFNKFDVHPHRKDTTGEHVGHYLKTVHEYWLEGSTDPGDPMIKSARYFVTSVPTKEFKESIKNEPETVQCDRYQEELRSIVDTDLQYVSQLPDVPVDVSDHVGFYQLSSNVKNVMLNRYRADLPTIKQGIQAKLEKIRDQIAAIGDVTALNDITLRASLPALCSTFYLKMRDLLEGTPNPAILAKYGKKMNEIDVLFAKKHPQLDIKFNYQKRYEQVDLMTKRFGELLFSDVPFLGGAMLRRVFNEFRLSLWTLEGPVPDRNTVINLRQSMTKPDNMLPPWHSVVSKIIQEWGPGGLVADVDIFCKKVAFICKLCFEPAFELCATQYPRLVNNPALAPAIQSVFESTLDDWQEKAFRAIKEFMIACFQSVESEASVIPSELVSGDSLSAQQVLERASLILRATPAKKTPSLLNDDDNASDPETFDKVRTVCRVYFERARERAHYNLDQLFWAFVKEPLFSTLNEVLADWAAKTDPFAELKSEQEKAMELEANLAAELKGINELM